MAPCLLCVIGITLSLTGSCFAGNCKQSYLCYGSCTAYGSASYGCDWFYARSCYRQTSRQYTCTKTCYRYVCCAGYTGSSCTTPICSRSCGYGRCTSPGHCTCPSGGYSTRTCADINECSTRSDGCEHNCTNTIGSFTCSCMPGFRVSTLDKKSCIDKNECQKNTDKCEQICNNAPGSYSCDCHQGYRLDTNGFECIDVNECYFFNGGCDDICENTIGSFQCSCKDGKTLSEDGTSCEGTLPSENVFKRYKIPRQNLPRGCFTTLLTKCTVDEEVQLYLSSTSVWYTLKSDSQISFTFGIVAVDVGLLSLPVSLNGATVSQSSRDFKVELGANGHKISDGVPSNNKTTFDCLSFEANSNDSSEFIASNSFLGSFLTNVYLELPNWITFSKPDSHTAGTENFNSELIYGRDMKDSLWFKTTPVLNDHLYIVYRFETGFSVSIYDETMSIQKAPNGKKHCLIVDICHNNGGSVFLIMPEDSSANLQEFQYFRDLYELQHLLIKPQAMAISLSREVGVPDAEISEMWNGDIFFSNTVPDRADVWITGVITKETGVFLFSGGADLYITLPNPNKMITGLFVDEWNILANIHESATLTLKMKLLGETHTILLKETDATDLKVYASFGGSNSSDDLCGSNINPPGIFVSANLKRNPLKNVPILGAWTMYTAQPLHAYFESKNGSLPLKDMDIDVADNFILLTERAEMLNDFFQKHLKEFGTLLPNETKSLLLNVDNALQNLMKTISSNNGKMENEGINEVSLNINKLWDNFYELESAVSDLLDFSEFQVVENNFTSFIKEETESIRQHISTMLHNLTREISRDVGEYDGFGIKYTANITLFELTLFDLNIEFVYRTNILDQCNTLAQAHELLSGEPVAIIRGWINSEQKLGHFLSSVDGLSLTGAIGIHSNNTKFKLKTNISMLRIKTIGYLYIGETGLTFSFSGDIWGTFAADIEVSSKLSQNWFNLKFQLRGKLARDVKDKDTKDTINKSFQDSYRDAFQNATRSMFDDAEKRLDQATQGLAIVQESAEEARETFNSKNVEMQNAESVLNNAVVTLNNAEDNLEEAEKPFNNPDSSLREMQTNIENVCKMRSCRTICIQAPKRSWCHTEVVRFQIKFPCIMWSTCIKNVPDPMCHARNSVCTKIRFSAYRALENRDKMNENPMLTLDEAKITNTSATFVVDKSRSDLTDAEHALDFAEADLNIVNALLEVAKKAPEAVKLSVSSKGLEIATEYDLQNIKDVRNCKFDIEITTTDPNVFDVICEINALKLGWKTILMRINFKNPYQTVWQAAKATLRGIIKNLENVSRRKRGELFDFGQATGTFDIKEQRKRSVSSSPSFSNATNTVINIVDDTQGLNTSVSNDYDSRVLLFRAKCTTITPIQSFLETSFEAMFDIANESKSNKDEIMAYSTQFTQIKEYSISQIADEITLHNAGINIEFAMLKYNLTNEDLDKALQKAKTSMLNDSFLVEIISIYSKAIKKNITAEIISMQSNRLMDIWFQAMENISTDLFEETECANFRDCVLRAINILNDLYTHENHPNITDVQNEISLLEDDILELFATSFESIENVFLTSFAIYNRVRRLSNLNTFCSQPPRFLKLLFNQEIELGKDAAIRCPVTAKPDPYYWWFKNDKLMEGEHSDVLKITNVTEDAVYKCMAGNIVANLTSNEARVFVARPTDVSEPPMNTPKPASSLTAAIAGSIVGVVVVAAVVALLVFLKRKHYLTFRRYKPGLAMENMLYGVTETHKPIETDSC